MTWNKKWAAARKIKIQKRLDAGLCPGCGAETNSHRLCDRCQERQNDRQRTIRLTLKENNLCRECGKVEVKDGQYYCDECNEKFYGRRVNRIDGFGICHTDGCDNRIKKQHHYCNECLAMREAVEQSCKIYFTYCVNCGDLFISGHKATQVCKECVDVRRKDQAKKRNRLKHNKQYTRVCCYCGEIFTTYNNRQKACCTLHGKRHGKRIENHKRRAIHYGASHIERVDVTELFSRDHGRCQLCRKKLNLKRIVPHPLAITIDHIIPLSKGGEHSYRNTQLVCFMCNSTKNNNKIEGGEQLRLF